MLAILSGVLVSLFLVCFGGCFGLAGVEVSQGVKFADWSSML